MVLVGFFMSLLVLGGDSCLDCSCVHEQFGVQNVAWCCATLRSLAAQVRAAHEGKLFLDSIE